MSNVRVRFAPSPTGFLHLGTLRTALYVYLFARKHGGTFILRIEDTDQEREVPGATEKIYEAMRLAGLDWDEGPLKGGAYGPYIQSERRDIYLPYAMRLVEQGDAYLCFCTEDELEQRRAAAKLRGETFKYDKHCLSLPKDEALRRMEAGERCVIRHNAPTEGVVGFDDELFGHIEVECDTLDDIVLMKADGLPTYNFANVIDDHLMDITHILRGTEFLSSTPKYMLLYKALGWTAPRFIHLPTIMKDATRKLSKRHGDPSFEDLLDMGYLKDAVINYITLLGWSPGDDREFFTLEELCGAFDEKGLSKSPAIFDTAKLNWFNGEYIKRMEPEAFKRAAEPWLLRVLPEGRFDLDLLCSLLRTRVDVFSQLPFMVDFLVDPPAVDPALYTNKKQKASLEIAAPAIGAALERLEGLNDFSQAAVHDCLMALPAALAMKTGQALWPVRVALTGRESTPGGAIEIAALLGRDETLRRLRTALTALEA